jgi:Fe-S cluster assembly iron-binding protein IscA
LPQYQALLDGGQIVWGALVHAHERAFAAGNNNLPGVVLYSPDSSFDEDPQALVAVAAGVRDLEDGSFDEPGLAHLAGLVSDDKARFHHVRVPESLTGGREVYCSTFLVHRGRLPTSRLVASFFPVMIDIARPPGVMILPGPYWGQSLGNHWRAMGAKTPDDEIEAMARPSAMSSADAATVRAAYLENPLRLTAAALARIREIVAQSDLSAETWLRVTAVRLDGMVLYEMNFSTDPLDPVRQLRTRTEAIDVVTDIESASLLVGVTMDFAQTREKTGFVFHEA